MAFDARFTLTLLLVLACAARTLAAPSPAERETARSLMVDGDRLRSAGDLQSALARYQAAHAIMNVPTTGLALAETQAALGLLVEARGRHHPVHQSDLARARRAESRPAQEELPRRGSADPREHER